MSRFPCLAASALAITCAATGPAQAAEFPLPITAMFGNALSDSDDIDSGPLLHLGVGHSLSRRFALELGLSYSDLAIKNNGGDNYERLGLGGSLHYRFADPDATTLPYALAGASAIRATLGGQDGYSPSFETGVGVIHHLRHTWVDLKGEVRYRFDMHNLFSQLDSDNFYDWTIGLGLVFNPGRQPVGNTLPDRSHRRVGDHDDLPETLAPVLFELDSASLTAQARRTLDQIIAILRENPGQRISITGHADDTGPADYNLRLSQRRAQAVRRYLTNAGIAAQRIAMRAVGERQPVASNTSSFGRQRNRRVEFELD